MLSEEARLCDVSLASSQWRSQPKNWGEQKIQGGHNV